jgi:hypothetical protein
LDDDSGIGSARRAQVMPGVVQTQPEHISEALTALRRTSARGSIAMERVSVSTKANDPLLRGGPA